MVINLPLKVLIGAGVAGAIGGGGYGIYIASQKEETILEALNKKNLTLLETEGSSDDAEWKKKVEDHKSATESTPKLDKYIPKDNGTDEEQKKVNVDSMKNICKSLVKELSKDQSKLAQAEKWCTKEKTNG